MTLLLNAQLLSKSFANKTLFKELCFSVFAGQKVGLIGPNGSGKSTLLKLIAGQEHPDEGQISPRKGLKVGYLPQVCDFPDLAPLEILRRSAPQLEEHVCKRWLSKLGFTGEETSASHLSGGWRKRLRLAQELLLEPDLMLLDEPTNHLDLEGVLWLEQFLAKEVDSFILVSHDRYFLEHSVNRVIELNALYPEGLFSLEGSYSHFLLHKEQFIQGQLEQQRSVASKARRELEWLRQSPKARTSKSKSRVEDAHALLNELSELRQRNKTPLAGIDFVGSERETRKLLTATNVSKRWGERVLFAHVNLTLSPQTRIGLIGSNGSGKTTLLQLLTGELGADQGTIKRADNLKIVYFDQHRTALPDDLTLKDALCPKGEFVSFGGKQIHINGWCKRFLFSPDALPSPIKHLSGGERARIAIAHLMLQPADLLLLDEPTNDLDIPTLEALEETLLEFPGAIVLISHDRSLMTRVCTSLIAIEGGAAHPFADFAQWEAAKRPSVSTEKKQSSATQPAAVVKWSYQDKKEYTQVEQQISRMEQEIRSLTTILEEPRFAHDLQGLQELCTQISLKETQLEQLYLLTMGSVRKEKSCL